MDLKNIYFDYQATTPMDKRILEVMMPSMTEIFGNAGSKTHNFGWEAEKLVENARQQVANLMNANAKDIIFTSGATESNNIAIKGVARFNKTEKNHIITTKIEHKCVLESCKYLELNENFKITYLNVDKDGLISLEELKNSITNKTVLVSIIAVNNEIGVIQNLKEIGKICKENDIYFHTDCAQAFGKIPLDVEEMNIDLMSISGHKIYGPKGIGALYVRRKPRIKIEPLFHGGGQERGLRSGTLPVFLIVGLGEAARLAKNEMEQDKNRINNFANQIIKEFSAMKKVFLNGSNTQRYFGCLNFTFSGIEGESLIMALKNIAVSSGSACTSDTLDPSYVIKAIGISDNYAHSTIRIGLGRFTTQEEVNYLIKKVKYEVEHLRKMSPLWEMMEKGINIDNVKWMNE